MRLCAIAIIICLLLSPSMVYAARYMENLDRGTVAVRISSNQVYVGWRMLGTEWGKNIGYHVYRGSTRITSTPITDSTNILDTTTLSSTYSISAVIDGVERPASPPVAVWDTFYRDIPLQRPAGGTTPDGVTYTYSPNDCSVGDLDGDGQYEIILKWDPSNSKDNSQSGYTGNVYLDAYEQDGTLLWRIDLGINIRAGAHYTQFIVYDLDSDGRAELVCKTADGTTDGQGTILGNPTADYRNSSGYILSGPEYLSVFDGQTGAFLDTVDYIPPRGRVSDWGDSYGNRVDRFLACAAYLDGVHPSVVMCRGYYTRAVLAAWDFSGGKLTLRWVFDTNNGYASYRGQGNHNLSVADVDGDGFDEIVYGSCTIDHDGTGLYSTGLSHGDALHVGDLDPSRPGLEVFAIHEPAGETVIGTSFRDAATGEIIWSMTPGDVGRGCADDIYAGNPGAEMWSSNTGGLRDRYGNYLGRSPSSTNFVIWWDSDLIRELLDSNHIDKYGTSSDTRLLTATNCSSNNGTKSTPCLSADILGDWREEVIWRTSDNTALRIYTTTALTSHRLYTLMHDPQYRAAIAWQNVAYNQPPHPSFHIGAGMSTPPIPDIVPAGIPVLYGDFNNDAIVDFEDLPYFLDLWLLNSCTLAADADFNQDCMVNLYEFAALAGNWAGSDVTPPAAPAGLTATAGNGTVSLDWSDNSESDLAGYKVYRSIISGSNYTLVSPLLNSSNYIDNDVVNGMTYYYVVTAIDKQSNESQISDEVLAKPDVITSLTIQENEPGFLGIVTGTIDSNHAGFTGTGFANTNNAVGSYIEWAVNTPAAGSYDLRWRFANFGTKDRTGSVSINGSQQAAGISFPITGAWTTWNLTEAVTVYLAEGNNVIRLTAETSEGLANIDWIEITGLWLSAGKS